MADVDLHLPKAASPRPEAGTIHRATFLAHEVRALANSMLGTLQLVVRGRPEEAMRAKLFEMLEHQARSFKRFGISANRTST